MDRSSEMAAEENCFCDLAPLYVLDLLTESERDWVEQQAAADPDLAAELAELQAAAAAVSYSAPPIAIAPALKERLFTQLGLEPPATEPRSLEPPAASPLEQTVRAKDLHWQPGVVPGVTVAILRRDEVSREVVGLLRAEPGIQYPLHQHAAMEEIYMLEGDLVSGSEIYGPGDYLRSLPNSTHGPHTVHGCKFFFRTSMDDRYPDFITAEA